MTLQVLGAYCREAFKIFSGKSTILEIFRIAVFPARIADQSMGSGGIRIPAAEQGISSGVYYPIPFHLQECFKFMGGNKGDFPVSESAAKEVLALPVYPGITAGMQERVVEQIKAFHFS